MKVSYFFKRTSLLFIAQETCKTCSTVYVYDEKIKRQLWNIWTIIELLPGRDGQVKSAIVRTIYKSKKSVKLIRPVQMLISLEVAATEIVKKEETVEEPQIRTVLDKNVPEMIR